MNKFREIVIELISTGADPNKLTEEFEEVVLSTQEWGLWGDGRWRKQTVCSKCGSPYAGIYSDKGIKVDILDFHNPAFHKNQQGVRTIPFKEYLKSHPDNKN